jgi:hypothetical protein
MQGCFEQQRECERKIIYRWRDGRPGHANDPYEEHDFGSFEVDCQTIFFKIDYLDKGFSLARPG